MRRIRRSLTRLWRMSDPYYAAKDDGLVYVGFNRFWTPEKVQKTCQAALDHFEDGKEDRKRYYKNDPSYDWVAETRRAKELRKAGGHGQEI